MAKLQAYAKFIAAIIGAGLTAGSQALPPNVSLWVGIVLAVLTAISVYAVPNKAPAPKAPPATPTGAQTTGPANPPTPPAA